MRDNHVRRRLRDGQTVFGTFVFEFATTGIGRIIEAAGADFVIYDLEHTGWSLETVRMLTATTRQAIPIVRVPTGDYHFIARVLDAGAMGVMVPMVDTAEQARQIVAATRYPPDGRRGAAFGVAHDDYQGGDLRTKMAHANENTLVILQIETAAGVENVESIAAVPGVDVLWIGQYDLNNFLGIPGEFDHPKYRECERKVLDAIARHRVVAGFLAMNTEHGRRLLEQNFRMLAYRGDIWMYQESLKAGLDSLRGEASS
jgi:2-dehydro-3-deoxyglucarate aldolase/4-hydroxy-2-oxoheptanedioate aldolase